jgi:glyoxylase-like metal-dependent hydrolase (beta-lactamase superfamily II)
MLYFGDRGVQLIHVGGHSCSSVLVYLQEERILFTGNVVVQDTHPVLGHSNSKEWLSVLTRIRRMPFDTLVPGHGEPGDGAMTEAVSEYIRRVRSGVRHHYRAGRSKAETYSKLLTLLDSFPVEETKREQVEQQFKVGVNQVYEELRTEKQD